MYLGDKLEKSVVFIGIHDDKQAGGINCLGTGFLLSCGNVGYLVTARHVAELVRDDPFLVRLNRASGGAVNIDVDGAPWAFHSDPTVDLAAIVFESKEAFESPYLHEEVLLDSSRMKEMDVSIGCICYVVGLFRYAAGAGRNLPVTYTGHIASLQLDEPIRCYNRATGEANFSRVFLVENHGVTGLSGSPVFVRQTRSLTYPTMNGGTRKALIAANEIDLLGVFVGAWFLPPDDVVKQMYGMNDRAVVPVGLGQVVPCSRLVELLEVDPLREARVLRRSGGVVTSSIQRRTCDRA